MSKKWIFIQAEDVWMFRTSKAFTAGENFIARSVFPPHPQTMQGIIRTHVIEQSGVDWAAFGNRRDESLIEQIGAPATRNQKHKATLGNFAVRGPLVGRKVKDKIEILVTTPSDVAEDKDHYNLAVPTPLDFYTNAPFEGWLPLTLPTKSEDSKQPDKKAKSDLKASWLDQANFQSYLEGKPPKSVLEKDQVFMIDERIGLALESGRRTSKEGHLYHAEFVRPCPDVGLLVEIEADLLPDHGYIGTGGEARFGYYETVDFQLPQVTIQRGRLKIVLLTPAYFSMGWQPMNGDWSAWVGRDARLVSMALDRPTLISGWDAAQGRAKALHHYVPAGSVFYFENAIAPTVPFTESIPNADFEGGLLDTGRLGFGCFAIGTW